MALFSPLQQKLAIRVVELAELEQRVIGRIGAELMSIRINTIGEDALRHLVIRQNKRREKGIGLFIVDAKDSINHWAFSFR